MKVSLILDVVTETSEDLRIQLHGACTRHESLENHMQRYEVVDLMNAKWAIRELRLLSLEKPCLSILYVESFPNVKFIEGCRESRILRGNGYKI